MVEAEVEGHIESLRELWLTESDLSFLRAIEPAMLARLVNEVRAHSERLHANQRAMYETLARASRFIPNFLLAKVSHGLGAYVLARITDYLEPKTAASLSRAFDPALLAETSLHLEPARVAGIAAHTQIDMLVQITDLLAQRGLSRRLGEIGNALEDPVLEKLVLRMGDAERIAAIAAHMNADKLPRVARRLDAPVLAAVIRALRASGHERAAVILAR